MDPGRRTGFLQVIGRLFFPCGLLGLLIIEKAPFSCPVGDAYWVCCFALRRRYEIGFPRSFTSTGGQYPFPRLLAQATCRLHRYCGNRPFL